MYGSEILLKGFLEKLPYEATSSQRSLFEDVAAFLTDGEGDILVVNGYAGTGKTSAISAIVSTLEAMKRKCILMAPTGRSAKVLSSYTGRRAATIHKSIYRQRSFGEDGTGTFALGPNKARNAVFIVDEVSLIGIEDASQKGGAVFGSGDLLADLVRFVRSGTDCFLILVGDSAQLPPVGMDQSPALSSEYMSGAGGVRFSSLDEVVRQEASSGILSNATRLRQLISNPFFSELSHSDVKLSTSGFDDILRVDGGELLDTLSDAYSTYGEDEVAVLARSNKRANRYNAGIRSRVLFHEEDLVRGEKLMIVKNNYFYHDEEKKIDYIANGDVASLVRIGHYDERYGLHFAKATLQFPDYDEALVDAEVCLDTLSSESPSLSYEQQNALFTGVWEDYSHLGAKGKIYKAMKEDPFFNALQIKYASAITCHKSQGGQWKCVFVDNPIWREDIQLEDLKWLYTALTRAVEKVYLVNFADDLFRD